MVLWQTVSYRTALDNEARLRQTHTRLRMQFGRRWKRKAPADLVWMLNTAQYVEEAHARVQAMTEQGESIASPSFASDIGGPTRAYNTGIPRAAMCAPVGFGFTRACNTRIRSQQDDLELKSASVLRGLCREWCPLHGSTDESGSAARSPSKPCLPLDAGPDCRCGQGKQQRTEHAACHGGPPSALCQSLVGFAGHHRVRCESLCSFGLRSSVAPTVTWLRVRS